MNKKFGIIMSDNHKYEKEFYVQDENKPEYMVLPDALRHTNTMAIIKYRDLIHGNIVDVGSDHSIYTLIAAENKNVTSAIGVDLFPPSLVKFERLKSYVHPDVAAKTTMVCANALELDQHFEENQFDSLLTFHMIEHLFPEDLDDGIQQMKRILKPEGYLIVSIPWETAHDSGNHCTFWNDVTLIELFENHGFETYDCFREINNHLTGAFRNAK